METAMSLLWTELNHSRKGEIKYVFILDWNLYHDSWNGRKKGKEEKQEDKKDRGAGRKEGGAGNWKRFPLRLPEETVEGEADGWKAPCPSLQAERGLSQFSQRLRGISCDWPCRLLAWHELRGTCPRVSSPIPGHHEKASYLGHSSHLMR